VRDALIWLGMNDAVDTMEKMRAVDPVLARLAAVISQWRAVIGTQQVSAKTLIDKATAQTQAIPDARGQWSREFLHPEFREALLAVAGDGSQISSRKLGQWLGLNKDRPIDGARIVNAGMTDGIVRWQVMSVSGAEVGTSGTSGSFPANSTSCKT
jgi:hypothetical protein